MQIALRHFGVDLGLVERAAETIGRPLSPAAAAQDRSRALRDTRDDLTKCAVQRDDRLAAVPALAGGEHDRIAADVRPGYARQIAQPQPGRR